MQNTTLITGHKYVKELFAKEQFYNIPEYQRPYVWGKEQINNLLDDIYNSLENNKDKEYFLGCMIWNTREEIKEDTRYKSQDILDGQQRFLTLFLLHVVIRNITTNTPTKSKIQARLVQEADDSEGLPERDRVVFEIRDDREFINKYLINDFDLNINLLDELINDGKKTTSVRNMSNGLKVIIKWFINKEFEYGQDFQEFLTKYYNYLSTKVLALYLATPNNLDDAYNLFTVLNSRGLQLQASDILRAQNLRVISEDRIRKKYAEKWDDFENKIEFPLSSVDEILWIVVESQMKYNSDDNQTLQKGFDMLYKKGTLAKGEQTIDAIEKHLEHFLDINNYPLSKDYGNLFNNTLVMLNNLFGTTHLMPLIYFKDKFGNSNLLQFLIKIDNLYSLAWLVGQKIKTTRTYFILKRIDFYYERVKSKELTIEKATTLMLEDDCLKYNFYDEKVSSEKPLSLETFRDVLNTEKWGAYAGTRVNRIRYLLLKLDLLLGNKNNVLQFNKSYSSVEHIMPQKIENTQWNIDVDSHKEWLHKLGNLVLLDRNKNASMSNLPYNVKKEKYKNAIENRIHTTSIFMNYEQWDEDTIIENHKRVVKLLMDYYRGNSVETFLEIQRNLSKYNPKQFV